MPSVHRLRMAQVNLKGQFNPPTFVDTRIDVYGFLVVTSTEVVLVDTGVGVGNAYVDKTFEPFRPKISDALARFDVGMGDVTMVVNSHLHFDHCGNNSLFPNAEFFVQGRELDEARTPLYTVPEWFDFDGARINSIQGDQVITNGVTIIASPGHTPGHQSVLVAGEGSDILIAAQASFTADEFRRGGDPEVQAHEGFQSAYKESIQRLKSIGPGIIMLSHDDDETWRNQ